MLLEFKDTFRGPKAWFVSPKAHFGPQTFLFSFPKPQCRGPKNSVCNLAISNPYFKTPKTHFLMHLWVMYVPRDYGEGESSHPSFYVMLCVFPVSHREACQLQQSVCKWLILNSFLGKLKNFYVSAVTLETGSCRFWRLSGLSPPRINSATWGRPRWASGRGWSPPSWCPLSHPWDTDICRHCRQDPPCNTVGHNSCPVGVSIQGCRQQWHICQCPTAQGCWESWESADAEHSPVFFCFPEQRALWDTVAGYIQQQLLLYKVGKVGSPIALEHSLQFLLLSSESKRPISKGPTLLSPPKLNILRDSYHTKGNRTESYCWHLGPHYGLKFHFLAVERNH